MTKEAFLAPVKTTTMNYDMAKLAMSRYQLLDDNGGPIDAYAIDGDCLPAVLVLLQNGYRVDSSEPYWRLIKDDPINNVGEYAVGRLQINDGDTLLMQMRDTWTAVHAAYYAHTLEDWALQRGKRWDVLPIPNGTSITVIPACSARGSDD